MKRKCIGIMIAVALIGSIAGCGNAGEEMEIHSTVATEAATPSPEPTEAATPEPTPVTIEGMIAEQELRLNQGLFVEKDYVALAELYGQSGDTEAERDMIYRALRLYPSEEYVNRLSNMVKKMILPDEQAQGLVGELENYLAAEDIVNAKGIINREEWNKLFQGELDVITGKTLLVGDEVCYQVESDGFQTVLSIFLQDGKVKYFQTNTESSSYFEGFLKEDSYVGEFTYMFWDGTDELKSRYKGTIESGHCVGELEIMMEGAEYTGEFATDGTTQEKQIEQSANMNRVIYAYNADKTKYLYATDANVAEWRLTAAEFGFPVIEEWQQ